MDKPTIEMLKAQFNLALTQVDERLQLPIQRYVDALTERNDSLERQIDKLNARERSVLEAISEHGTVAILHYTCDVCGKDEIAPLTADHKGRIKLCDKCARTIFP